MATNLLYNNDCLDVLKGIPDGTIDLIATDPPYKTTARGNHGNAGGMFKKDLNKKGMVFNHNSITPDQYASEFYRVLKEDSHCYVMTNHVNLISMLNEFTNAGFHFIKSLIWNKKQKDTNGNNLHDTEKPVELMRILVENSSRERELVLDPFMGIGATGVACKQLNRNFIGVELDPQYFEIAKHRIED